LKYKLRQKLCSALITFFFTASSIPLPGNADAQSVAPETITAQSIFTGLSPEICDVEEIWTAPQAIGRPVGEEPLVVLLQEAHVNYLAQKNIIATLEFFESKFREMKINDDITIGLEGNPYKEIDPVIFRVFPDRQTTKDVTNSLMWEGKIDGAEFYAVNSNPGAVLFGIDDPSLYEKNDEAYQELLANQSQTLSALGVLRTEVRKLEEKVYSKPLRDLSESRRRLDADIGTLRLHLIVLARLARLKNMSFDDYPEVREMKKVFDEEDKIDQKLLARELAGLGLNQIEGESEKGWKIRVRKKWGLLSDPEKENFSFVRQWIAMEDRAQSLRSFEFFAQMAGMESELSNRLAVSRDEETAVLAGRYLELLEKLASLALDQSGYEQLEKHWAQMNEPAFWRDLDDLVKRRNNKFKFTEHIDRILIDVEPAREFYSVAKKRDQLLSQNIERLMAEKNQKILFVIAGGFHTEGLTQKLQEKGISYWALLPMANPDWDDSVYWSRLSGEESPVKNILAQLAQSAARKLTSLQDNPEFQAEAVTDLVTVEAASLGLTDEFQKKIKRYEEALRTQANNQQAQKAADFVQFLMRQLDALRKANPAELAQKFSRVEPRFLLVPLKIGNEQFYLFARRWTRDSAAPGGIKAFPEIPPGFYEVNIQVSNPLIRDSAFEGNFYSLTVVKSGERPPTMRLPEGEMLPPGVPAVRPPAPAPAATIPQEQTPEFKNLPPELRDFARAFSEKLLATGQFTSVNYKAKGAMGMVFEGRQKLSDTEVRLVAIKTLQPGLLREDIEEKRKKKMPVNLGRMQREAEALALVSGLIGGKALQIHRSGDVEIENYGQVPYYVMEYLPEVKDLKSLLEESPGGINYETAIRLIRGAALQLDQVHQAGVTHRDIKPANIGLKPVEEGLRSALDPTHIEVGSIRGDYIPIIIDFGFAKLEPADDNATQAISLTMDRDILGTPVFMSPEQAQKTKAADPRADIYSLAASLFQLLTGEVPISWNPQLESFDIYSAKLNTPLIHAKKIEQALTKLDNIGITGPARLARLKDIFRSGLAGNKSARYANAKDFADDLEAFLENRTVKAQTWASRFWRWAGKYQKQLLAAALVSVIPLTAGVIAIVDRVRESQVAAANTEARDQAVAAARASIATADDEIINSKFTEANLRLSDAKRSLSILPAADLSATIRQVLEQIDARISFISRLQDFSPSEKSPEKIAKLAEIFKGFSDSTALSEALRVQAKSAYNSLITAAGKVLSGQIPGVRMDARVGADLANLYLQSEAAKTASGSSLWIKANAQALLGDYAGSNTVLDRLFSFWSKENEEVLQREDVLTIFFKIPNFQEAYFLYAANLSEIAVNQPFEAGKQSFEAAKRKLQELDSKTSDEFPKQKINKTIADISVLEAAFIWASVTDISSPHLSQTPADNQKSEERLVQLRIAREKYRDIIRILDAASARLTPEEAVLKAENLLGQAVLESIQLSHESDVRQQGIGSEKVDALLQSAREALTAIQTPEDRERLSRAIDFFARTLTPRNNSVVRGERSARAREAFQRVPEGQSPWVRQMASVLAREGAAGRSLGVSRQDFERIAKAYLSGLQQQLKAQPQNQDVIFRIRFFQNLTGIIPGLPPIVDNPFRFEHEGKSYLIQVLQSRFEVKQAPPVQQAAPQAPYLPPGLENDNFVKIFNSRPNRKWTITGVLGRGGMGVVYEAKDQAGNSVAVKTIQSEGTDEATLKRFEREAGMMMQINHLRVAKVFEYVDESFNTYYVMEKLKGQDWHKLMNGWQYPLDEQRIPSVLKLMLEALTGLKTIHDLGLAHRDLKPANIFMVPGRGAVITDFGLAIFKGEKERLTKTGEVVGTPSYMSPEQMTGDKKDPINDSSDIFSMGVILYELLTNKLPFEGSNALTTMNKILHDEPAPPNSVNPEISDALNAVVMKALAKKPGGAVDERYENVDAFIKDLLRVLTEYEGRETAIESAVEFDRISQGSEEIFSMSLEQPVEALQYYRQLQGKKTRRQFLIAGAFAGVAALFGLGAYTASRVGESRTAQAEQRRREGKAAVQQSIANEVKPAFQRGDYRGAKQILDGLAAKSAVENLGLDNEISAYSSLASALSVLTSRDKDNKEIIASVSPQMRAANMSALAVLMGSKESPEFVRNWAQFYSDAVKLNLPEADTSIHAGIASNILKNPSLIPQGREGYVISKLPALLEAASKSPRLNDQQIEKILEAANLLASNSDLMNLLSPSQKAEFSFQYAELFLRPGPHRAAFPSRTEFANASRQKHEAASAALDDGITRSTVPAERARLSWLKTIVQYRLGQFDQVMDTLNNVGTAASDRDKELLRLRAMQAMGDYDGARKRIIESGADSMPARKILMENYMLEMASIMVRHRNVYEVRNDSNGPMTRAFGEMGNKLISFNSRLKKFTDESKFTAVPVLSLNNTPTEENEFNLRRSALEFFFLLGLIRDLEFGDFGRFQGRAGLMDNARAEYVQMLEAKYPESIRNRFDPLFPVGGFLAGRQGRPDIALANSDISRGIIELAIAIQLRRESIDRAQFKAEMTDPRSNNSYVVPEQDEQRVQSAFANSAEYFYDWRSPYAMFARQMTQEGIAQGQSLGRGKEIFDQVQTEKRFSPVFMEYNPYVLSQLIDEKEDFRSPVKAQPIFFLVKTSKQIRQIQKQYPTLWEDYGIGLVRWTEGPISTMMKEDVETLLNKNEVKRMVGKRVMPQQPVFLNGVYEVKDIGDIARRVKYDPERFAADSDYRAAYLAAALNLVHDQKAKTDFKLNSEDGTLELLPEILQDLIQAWQALKRVLVAA